MKALLVLVLVLLSLLSLSSAANNITDILASQPDYSTFSSLLTQTGVASQIFSSSSITVLAVPNSILDPIVKASTFSPSVLYDIISYHVLLDYFDLDKFKAIANGTTLSTTLYQASGQATGQQGFVNVTVVGNAIRLGLPNAGEFIATVENEIYKSPYNISVVGISNVLVPNGVGAPAPSPAPVNLTSILIQSMNYTTLLTLLKATGVDAILAQHDTPPGLTVFAPDDGAFSKIPAAVLANLTSDQKVALLKYHCIGTFYSTQELTALTTPVTTLASSAEGGTFLIQSITAKGGGTVIDTGLNQVPVGPTLYSQEPLGLYGISTVLLPTDIFGVAPTAAPAPTPLSSPTPTPGPSSVTTPALAPGPVGLSPPAPPVSVPPPTSSESGSHSTVVVCARLLVPMVVLSAASIMFL